jgi:pilus assembly protein CpaE
MTLATAKDLYPVRAYPMKAVAIGCQGPFLAELQRGLGNFCVEQESEFPSVVAAEEGLPLAKQRRRLLIVHVAAESDLAPVERLNETFPGNPILALVDLARSAQLLPKVMRAGAAQIVGVPLGEGELKAALERIAVQFGYAVGRAQVIAVSGVAGGSGATTLALNLAEEIARIQSAPCILMELALALGRVATYLDIDPQFTTADLLSDPNRLDLEVVRSALVKVAEQFYVLSGPNREIVRPGAHATDVLRLVEHARRLAGILVLDLPCTFDDAYFGAIEMAHHIVLVGQQDISSLRGLRLLHETLARRGSACIPHVVINRYNAKFSEFSVASVQKSSGWKRISTVANDYKGVVAAVNHGLVLRQAAPSSPALADIESLAREILGLGDVERRGLRHHLGRLLSAKVVFQV